MNKNMKVNRNRPPQKNSKKKNTKYILFGAAALLVVAIIVIIIIVSAQSCNPDDGDFKNVDNETAYIYSDQDGDQLCDGTPDSEGTCSYTANLYKTPSKDEIALTLPCGTEVIRTGILFEDIEAGLGWSRVEYNGETYYIRNSCITATKPHSTEDPVG